MTETPEQRRERADREADAWRNYNERLAAWKNGTLPMPPKKPVRYPFS